MKNITLLILLLAASKCYCDNIKDYFENINTKVGKFSAFGADLSWQNLVDPNGNEEQSQLEVYKKNVLTWQQRVCDDLLMLYKCNLLNDTQQRQAYLFCRGPRYTPVENWQVNAIINDMQSNYSNNNVCFAPGGYITKLLKAMKLPRNFNSSNNKTLCLKGESEFISIMKQSTDEPVLRYVWTTWRENFGPETRDTFQRLVNIENTAAQRNGHHNIGSVQKEDLEIPFLRDVCFQLYNDVLPLYRLLHGVVRFYLRKHYGNIVPERGPIPAHLLGSLWSENWSSLSSMMVPQTAHLDRAVSNWTIENMANKAEDYYISLGLPEMTDEFWRYSVFTAKYNNTRCHGTAADMFKDKDYRILFCPSKWSNRSMEDFYVIHHEMGHIQYYMAYAHQPTLFRQANSALHETIGDVIMLGVMTPQHLYRLNLINDTLLFTSGKGNDDVSDMQSSVCENQILLDDQTADTPLFDDSEQSIDNVILLYQAMLHLPQIPFTLLLDEYRWKYYENDMLNPNEEFWTLAQQLQGIAPLEHRSENYFDPGAMYLVADHTPSIRYFLANFIQYELFARMCKAATFGRLNVKEPLPDTIALNRCDLYGSRASGKLLRDLMSRGHSQPIADLLYETFDAGTVSAESLLRYYQPLQTKLERFVKRHGIPIGW